MTKENRPRGACDAGAAMMDCACRIVSRDSVDCADAVRETLLTLLEGAAWATARRDGGRPARIAWPADAAQRAALVDAHLAGRPATLTFHAESGAGRCEAGARHASGGSSWRERVARLELAALCPDADGRARWLGVDLDAGGDDAHGARGLADAAHAARCIASCADAAGFCDGLLVARSRSGRGRHVWLVLPEATPLEDAVVGVAALAAGGFRLAQRDVSHPPALHALTAPDNRCRRQRVPQTVGGRHERRG